MYVYVTLTVDPFVKRSTGL